MAGFPAEPVEASALSMTTPSFPALLSRSGVLAFAILCWLHATSPARGAADFEVTAASEDNAYTVNGEGWNPTLTLVRGRTYTFHVEACDCHPVIIVGGGLGAVDNNDTWSGTITFRVPEGPGTYAYRCSIHHFGGIIQTIDPPPAQVIRITGPASSRPAVHAAIANILTPGFTHAWTGPDANSATRAIFSGTTKAPVNAPVIIKTHWTSTLEGLRSVARGTPLTNAWLVDGTPRATAGTPNAPGNFDAPAPADIALSECSQNSTPHRLPVLVDRVTGVQPYQWVRNHGSPHALDNMTARHASNVLNGGILLSQFTARPADNGTLVLCAGRDESSGARFATFAETRFGVYSNPTQYRVNLTGTPVAAASLEVWPASAVLGANYPPGHSGEADGAVLAAKLSAPGTLMAAGDYQGWLVSYLPVQDVDSVAHGTPATAGAAITGGGVSGVTVTAGGGGHGSSTTVRFTGGGGTGAAGVPVITDGVITAVTVTSGGTGYTSAPAVTFHGAAALRWNGVAYSPEATREGQYTFWSYQHLYYKNGYTSSAVADQLATRLRTVETGLTGILPGTMKVGRPVEGGDVTPGNPWP